MSADSRRNVHWLVLAHHRPPHTRHCLQLPLGAYRLALCSRCTGLYATLFATLVLQLTVRPALVAPAPTDAWLLFLGTVPAVLDWSLGRLNPSYDSGNRMRLLTGALLGLALGRSLLRYFRDPLDELFWLQAALVLCAIVATEVVRSTVKRI